jgi:uncharacterized protein involved in oxidation of intracellular sulfur
MQKLGNSLIRLWGIKTVKLGIVIYSSNSEVVWNAFRLGVYSLRQGDSASVFLLGQGVEAESLDNSQFKVTEQMHSFVDEGGVILACGTCLTIRHAESSEMCPMSTMTELYDIIRDADRVVTF